MRTAFVLSLALFALSGLGCTGNPTAPATDNPASAERTGALGFAAACTCGYDASGLWRIDPICREHGIQTYKPPKRLGS